MASLSIFATSIEHCVRDLNHCCKGRKINKNFTSWKRITVIFICRPQQHWKPKSVSQSNKQASDKKACRLLSLATLHDTDQCKLGCVGIYSQGITGNEKKT